MNILKDKFGRQIKKLRVSLTDKCNLRCHYCMPIDSTFISSDKYIKTNDLIQIINELNLFGLNQIRFTGGEPLLREQFREIINRINHERFQKIGLTSNGILLDRYFDDLKKNNVHFLNISLDSLDSQNFKSITHGNHFSRVLENILTAKKLGFHVKLNCVVMRGINDHEVNEFLNFSAKYDIEVRFLELMKIGYANKEQNNQFISANEIIQKNFNHLEFKKVDSESDSTSFCFAFANGAKIGFIASESQAFCGTCSRWRLSCDGILRACLFKEEGINLKGLDKLERIEAYSKLLDLKPYIRPVSVEHQMNILGG